MKIVVFGASGYIGQTLTKYLLDHGHEVTGVFRTKPLDIDVSIKVEILETSKQAETIIQENDPDLVINVSNYFSRTAEADDIDKFAEVNTVLVSAICKGCLSASAAFIQVGSAWEADFTADDPSLGNTYALYKGIASNIGFWYKKSFGLKYSQLNLFDTYGEGDTRGKIVQFLTEQLNQSKPLDLSGGMQILELVHVEDVSSCITKLGDLLVNNKLPQTSDKYACFPNSPVTLRQVVETIDQISEKNVPVNWGAREYRVGEMFERDLRGFKPVPGWESTIDLKSGISRVLKFSNSTLKID